MSDRIAVLNQRPDRAGRHPREVYEQPATEFVAGFVGISNLLERGRPASRPPGEDPHCSAAARRRRRTPRRAGPRRRGRLPRRADPLHGRARRRRRAHGRRAEPRDLAADLAREPGARVAVAWRRARPSRSTRLIGSEQSGRRGTRAAHRAAGGRRPPAVGDALAAASARCGAHRQRMLGGGSGGGGAPGRPPRTANLPVPRRSARARAS